MCKLLQDVKLYPVENFPPPILYNLKANILKVINNLAEIAIKGLLVLNFAPAAQENFSEQVNGQTRDDLKMVCFLYINGGCKNLS